MERPTKPTPAGKALVKSVTRNLGPALAALGHARQSDTVLVHNLRKSMKRWRATLRLIEPFIGHDGRTARVAARDLARTLAGAREPRSALDALADLGKSGPGLPADVIETMRVRLEALRQEAEATSLADTQRARLKNILAATAKQAERWPLSRIATAEVAKQIARGYRRARNAMPNDFASVADGDLHEFRQRVVVHRYQMELVAPFWPKRGDAWVAKAQELREELGACQDLAVLTRYAAPRAPLAPWRSRLAPAIEARQRAHRKAAARIARRLFAKKPDSFRRQIEGLWKRPH